MREPRERIFDMLEAIERIEKYAGQGRSVFESDELIQTWVVHHLRIIGEAAAKLGREFHEAYRDIAWPQVIAMRSVLVHDYFGIDLEEVWTVVERDIPDLKERLQTVLTRLN